MKKLMIAAAIVCAAAMSQAADCNWKFSTAFNNGVFNPGGESAYNTKMDGQTYLDSKTYVFMITDSFNQGDVYDAWKSATTKTTALDSLGAVAASKVTGGTATAGGSLTAVTATTTGTGSDTQNFFLALVTEDGNLYISDTKSGVESTATSGRAVAFQALASSKKALTTEAWAATGDHVSGWYSAVPEPTSGLLLLLGVAGLALRRRRA